MSDNTEFVQNTLPYRNVLDSKTLSQLHYTVSWGFVRIFKKLLNWKRLLLLSDVIA